MGTAHGAEELGLCPHGLACQAGAWGLYYVWVLPRVWPYLAKIQSSNNRQKYSARPITLAMTLAHDEILTNNFFQLTRGTLEMQIAVSRE